MSEWMFKTEIGYVVKVLAGNKPDDLANLPFGIIAGHPGKSVGVNLFMPVLRIVYLGASSIACSMATSMLRSSALPLPAMSKAVP
jgi:hypothetical protein